MKNYKYKITICGHFGGNKEFYDGQTVKTKNIYLALLDKYKKENINIIDTYGWKKQPIKFLIKCINGIKKSENIIILPARNGVKAFIPIFLFINKLYKRKIFYIVIGGWLFELLTNRKRLTKKIKKLDKVFVETNNMKENLSILGIDNVEVLVNFKNIKPIENDKLNFNHTEPYRLCTFSRVMKEKGIEDAIEVVKKINEESRKEVYQLDIYGAIDNNYKEEFENVMKKAPEYVQYRGCIDSNKSIEILKEYYLLLFPTRFNTEGIPGTIIDALAAGIPIVASNWENAREIIEEGRNSLIFEINNTSEFYEKLKEALDYEKIFEMKSKCIEDSKKFTSKIAMSNLYGYIGE